jgi:capsular exopolysaccharide synthesis family protein
VTSSVPAEGKTTVCFNLGLTVARLGIKTLVIDTDLRWAGLKKIIGKPENRGLTKILVDAFNTKTDQGTLGELSIADIHKILELQERSGILTYKTDKQAFAVSFLKGFIIGVDWLTRPLEHRLGELLIQNGIITPEQVQTALTKQQKTSQRLGQVLLHMGFTTVDELAGPLRLHIQENIGQLQRCQENAHQNIYFTFKESFAPKTRTLDPKEDALLKAMGNMEYTVTNDTPFLLGQINQQLFEVGNENLWILPSGHLPPNPVKLLTSKRMQVLVNLLRNEFDLILMDSPPIGAVNDAAVLAALADQLIFVIKAGSTPVNKIRQAAEQLNRIQTPITGTVLNMASFQKDSYIENYHYYESAKSN